MKMLTITRNMNKLELFVIWVSHYAVVAGLSPLTPWLLHSGQLFRPVVSHCVMSAKTILS